MLSKKSHMKVIKLTVGSYMEILSYENQIKIASNIFIDQRVDI